MASPKLVETLSAEQGLYISCQPHAFSRFYIADDEHWLPRPTKKSIHVCI